jgi:hypothetical protein
MPSYYVKCCCFMTTLVHIGLMGQGNSNGKMTWVIMWSALWSTKTFTLKMPLPRSTLNFLIQISSQNQINNTISVDVECVARTWWYYPIYFCMDNTFNCNTCTASQVNNSICYEDVSCLVSQYFVSVNNYMWRLIYYQAFLKIVLFIFPDIFWCLMRAFYIYINV